MSKIVPEADVEAQQLEGLADEEPSPYQLNLTKLNDLNSVSAREVRAQPTHNCEAAIIHNACHVGLAEQGR